MWVLFQGAAEAGDRAAGLDVFKDSQTVKINPDKPQEQCRFKTLEVCMQLSTNGLPLNLLIFWRS